LFNKRVHLITEFISKCYQGIRVLGLKWSLNLDEY